MKHLIMWGGLSIVSIMLVLIYQKISVMDTFFDLDKSPIYSDIIFFALGAILVITRGMALIRKLF